MGFTLRRRWLPSRGHGQAVAVAFEADDFGVVHVCEVALMTSRGRGATLVLGVTSSWSVKSTPFGSGFAVQVEGRFMVAGDHILRPGPD